MRINPAIHTYKAIRPELTASKLLVEDRMGNNDRLLDFNYGRYLVFKGTVKPFVKSKDNLSSAQKLDLIRKEMKALNLDALLVSSTDEYLNEIIGKKGTQKEYLSDFTGSKGDIIITDKSAHLFVDSRYHIQADKEVDHTLYTVEKIGVDNNGNPTGEDEQSRISSFIKQTALNKTINIGYDPERISIKDITYLKHLINKVKVVAKFIPTEENLVDKIRGGKLKVISAEIKVIPDEITGESTESKLDRLKKKLEKEKIESCVLTNLFDIAYLTNLRGDDTPYSATFNAKAIFAKGNLTVFCDDSNVPEETKNRLKGRVKFLAEQDFEKGLDQLSRTDNPPKNISFYQDETSTKTYNLLKNLGKDGIRLIELKTNPVTEMRVIKNNVELQHYTTDLHAADRAMNEVINLVNDSVNKGKVFTELDLEIEVEKAHKRNGATKLSFATIPSAGNSTEEAHYMTANSDQFIQKGDLVLVDTGGFYRSGLSTDLTRTWIAGGNEGIEQLKSTSPAKLDKIKRMYSIVMKTMLNVMNAEIPPESTGKIIDKICTRTYEEYNLPIEYGWGHGTGVNVHEFPPHIDSYDHGYWDVRLKEGMTFAIEPGYYEKGFGGIRLENIVAIKKHHNKEKADAGWHEVECLSYTPIETNLLDPEILTKEELKLIKDYKEKALANVNK